MIRRDIKVTKTITRIDSSKRGKRGRKLGIPKRPKKDQRENCERVQKCHEVDPVVMDRP